MVDGSDRAGAGIIGLPGPQRNWVVVLLGGEENDLQARKNRGYFPLFQTMKIREDSCSILFTYHHVLIVHTYGDSV
jgi:hypothetical protein